MELKLTPSEQCLCECPTGQITILVDKDQKLVAWECVRCNHRHPLKDAP